MLIGVTLVLILPISTVSSAGTFTFPVQSEQAITGTTTGLAGAQTDDGVREGLHESDTASDPITTPSTQTLTTGTIVGGAFPAGITSEDATFVQYREALPPSSNYYPSTQTITTGSACGGTFPTSLQSSNDAYLCLREGTIEEALIGYRSNTGTNTVNSPKTRPWDGAAWGGETERATAGSPIRAVRMAWSPIAADTRIIVTLSDDGWLDAYVCTPTCTVTNNIGQVWSTAPTTAEARFDIAYEYTSGEALLVYGVLSTDTTRDIAYKTYIGGSWSAEQYLDDTGHATDVQYSLIRLAAKKASNQIGLIGGDDTNDDVNAWIWDGSAWGSNTEITATATSPNREEAAIAWETNSGDLLAIAALASDMVSKEYTSSWSSAVTSPFAENPLNRLSLKANPAGDDMIVVMADEGDGLETTYWTGSAWANNVVQDGDPDAGGRAFDFAWELTGSNGLLVWGDNAGQISYKTFTAPNTWGSQTNVAMGANAHPWVQLRTNPRSGSVKILGAVMEATALDLGAIRWDGSTFTIIGASTFTANVGTVTYDSFELEYRELLYAQVEYVVCKNLASSNCDASGEFTKFDGTAGADSVATETDLSSYPSLATTFEANGDLWVAYSKDVTGTTRAIYARFLDYPSLGWQTAETVDSLTNTIFTKPSIGIDKDNDVHALYVDSSATQVYYKERAGGTWSAREAVGTSSDNPTIIVRAPNHATYGISAGGLYWKTSTSETYFHIPEFETLVLPVVFTLIVVWGWRRTKEKRKRDAADEPGR